LRTTLRDIHCTNSITTSASNVAFNNTFTPAHQWASGTISTAAYRFVETGSGADAYAPVNGLNQYVSVDSGAATGHDCQGNAQMFSYDCKGNLTGDGTFTYTYDTENRLLTAVATGVSASYAYDPMGRRQSKTVSGTTTLFVDDGDTEVGEYDGTSGNIQRRYVPGAAIDDLIAMVDCTNATPPNCTGGGVVKTYFHTDKMGSVVAMSKSDGTLAEGPYTYDPYGNCVGGGSSCGTGEPYRFTGQRLDPETGLYYYRARYYSPTLGRFLQTDPVGYKDDIDWYTYVGNDPTDKTDPSGKVGTFVEWSVHINIPSVPIPLTPFGPVVHTPKIDGSAAVGIAVSQPSLSVPSPTNRNENLATFSDGAQRDIGVIFSVGSDASKKDAPGLQDKSISSRVGVSTDVSAGVFRGSVVDQGGASSELNVTMLGGSGSASFNNSGQLESVSGGVGEGVGMTGTNKMSATLSLQGLHAGSNKPLPSVSGCIATATDGCSKK